MSLPARTSAEPGSVVVSRMKLEHFAAMHPRLNEFRDVCMAQDPGGHFRSDQSRRLGILP